MNTQCTTTQLEFQPCGHRNVTAVGSVQYLRKRVTGHTQHLGRFGDIQTEQIQAALLVTVTQLRSIWERFGGGFKPPNLPSMADHYTRTVDRASNGSARIAAGVKLTVKRRVRCIGYFFISICAPREFFSCPSRKKNSAVSSRGCDG